MGYSPWGHKESDMTEGFTLFFNSSLTVRSIEESGTKQDRVQEFEYYPCLAAICLIDTAGKFLWTHEMKGNQV